MAIDTATETSAIALGKDGDLIDESAVSAGRSHLEIILSQIDSLLGKNGFKASDINAIVIGTGPGTFTGLRVGITTGRALAQTLGIPLFGFSTLRALAEGIIKTAPQEAAAKVILPLIDAKRRQVFAQFFRVEDRGDLNEASDILCLGPDELLSMLPGFTDQPILAAGNGLLAYWPEFEGAGQVEIIGRGDTRHQVRAAHHLTAVRDVSYDPQMLQKVLPVYVRTPDADKTVLLRKRGPWLK